MLAETYVVYIISKLQIEFHVYFEYMTYKTLES